MSGLCGVVNLNRAPVRADLIHKMAQAAAYRGPDGIRYHIDDNIGFVHLALHITPESTRERQPLVNRRGDLVLVADARVDDRGNLIDTLAAKGSLREQTPTDADLILAAYDCWGADCPEHLLGDFAFVIWDARRQRVFSAVDRAGARPFYYRWTDGCFQWATEAAQLLADPAHAVRLNEETIAHDLARPGYGGRHESYYQGIEKLGPADCLLVEETGPRRRHYWELDPQRRIRYANDDEYAEHFGELFRQAVRDRLRSIRPVGLFLSGGLDSASIAAVAARELQRTPGELAPGLHAINWQSSAAPTGNEYQYSRAVAEQWGFEYHEVEVDPYWAFYDYPRRLPHKDDPFSSLLAPFFTGSLETLSPRTRPRVWMTGGAGDYLVGGADPWHYSNLLKRAELKRLVGEFASLRRRYNVPMRMVLLNMFLTPLLLQPVKQRLAWRMGWDRVYARLPAWISPALAQRTGLVEWVRDQPSLTFVDSHPGPATGTTPAQDWRWRMLTAHRIPRMHAWFGRMAAEFAAESWEPWSDSRLAEFVLAIPQGQLCVGIDQKRVLRRSLHGLLPEPVRRRRGLRQGPGHFTEAGLRHREATQMIDAALARARAGRMGLLDIDALRSALRAFRARGRYPGLPYGLNMALSLEFWLQTHGSDTASSG